MGKKRHLHIFWLAGCILTSNFFLVYADVGASTEEVIIEEKNIKADKGFGAQLWLTDDMEFVKKWNTPGAGVQIKKVNIAERGKPIQLITFFAGSGVDARGLCDISCDITVYAPDGSVYGELKDVKCWKDLPAPPPNDIQMSQGAMGIMIEEKDKSGRYRVEETIKDNVKQVSLFLEQYFDVK